MIRCLRTFKKCHRRWLKCFVRRVPAITKVIRGVGAAGGSAGCVTLVTSGWRAESALSAYPEQKVVFYGHHLSKCNNIEGIIK